MSDEAEREARRKAAEYFEKRGTRAPVAEIRERIEAAFTSLDALLATVPPEQALRRTRAGEWSIQEIVDHLVETHRPGVDELRCLLAGQRPAGEPIPPGLQSKAPTLRPWPWLLDELHRIHGEIRGLLADVPVDFETPARAPIVMVVNTTGADGSITPVHWVEDLDWKAYAIVWRLHVVDHMNQARKVLGAR